MNATQYRQTNLDQLIHIHSKASSQINTDLQHLIGSQSFQVDLHADIMANIGAAAIGKQLSFADRTKLEEFGSGLGEPYVLIDNLPQQLNLPPTPDQFHDDAAVQYIDCQLLGSIHLTRLQSIAFEYENFGRLIRNVAPVANALESVTSHGSKRPLAFHTDNAYEFESSSSAESPAPRVLGFAGLRNRDAKGHSVPTELIRVQDIVRYADSRLVKQLRRRIFRIMPGQSNDRAPIGPVPLLEECRKTGADLLRLNVNEGQTIGLNRAANLAIDALKELLESLESEVIAIHVDPGTVLMFDNYRSLHRRSSFDPGDKLSQARWLRRCFACQERRSGIRVDRLRRPFVWK